MKVHPSLLISLAIAMTAPAAQARDAGEWIWRAGAHTANPKSDNHDLVNVRSATTLTFNATYLFRPHWGVELLAALPFTHDIDLNSGGNVAKVKHLPPTLSLQYHFIPDGTLRPYIGAGMNYTLFFSEHTRGALGGTDLKLAHSVGPALQAGMDMDIGSGWFVNVDARWFDIDTEATLNGASLGTVEIDPYALGVSIGRRF